MASINGSAGCSEFESANGADSLSTGVSVRLGATSSPYLPCRPRNDPLSTIDTLGRRPVEAPCFSTAVCDLARAVAVRSTVGPSRRASRQSPLGEEIERLLAQLRAGLSEAANLSGLIGRSALTAATSILNQIGQPAFAISATGLVLEVNAAAERLFGQEIRVLNRRLYVTDKRANAEVRRLVEQLRVEREDQAVPTTLIVVRRTRRPPIVMRVLPVPLAARGPSPGARALLTLRDVDEKTIVDPELLVRAFGLTNAEARLASLISVGESIKHAAEELSISPLTARTQLKAIFAKTDTHRQSELVALLSRLTRSRTRSGC
ncbi:hypothetical protein CL689_04415 [Candidatus Saccharibacteria bacterium]|nr:hypothetical protein [Candidatus Saccharibacteria bacterium]